MIELFSGTGRMAEAFKAQQFETFTVDIEYEADLKADIKDVHAKMLPQEPFVIWASPPCTTFSVASVGHHWKGHVASDKALEGLRILSDTLKLIMQLRPAYWFIENPRGMMRKMPLMASLPMKTVTYCQYGDDRMKPTDIWTNATDWTPRPMCSPKDWCHISAPRGARTGTQGLKGSYERSALPIELCEEIAKNCKHYLIRDTGYGQTTLTEGAQ